ncbi:hypothetical protein HRR81_000288 [Exophiala dermatitidis]|nr:hypothetical protein HRR79_000291 [Exophiala dermatitidis]KAJ4584482.1 hypothetical protein HRR81_000288 [Exophiala dermatitidis]KAJ9004585.1 hypothetical protein HRR94_000290 [Exophiala dermatitidis]
MKYIVSKASVRRLPLHPEDANALIQVSRQSTSNKEEKAVARETVRKTWEIDGEELSFGNEDWNSWLYQIVVKVRKGLGIPRGAGSIRAELSKLVVYEEGAFSKPQEDTEMTRNMFGTLEICLPSEHVGGGVRLIQGHAERVLETDKSSSYGVSYLACDVSHEVLPIQAGYRVVLTYDLINDTTELELSAAVQDAEQSGIKQMLNEWHSMPDRPALMCYILQHADTSPDLRLGSLKGDDYYRCSQLHRACRSNGRFCVFLSRLRQDVTRSNDEDGGDLEERACLRDIVTLRGDKLQNILAIQTDCLAQGYEDSQPHEQWDGAHSDDQHAEAGGARHDTVAIIVPRDSATESLLGHGYTASDYSELLRRLCDNLAATKNDYEQDLFCEMIVQTCRRHIKRRYNNNQEKDAFMGPTAIASLHIRDSELAGAALDSVKHSFDAFTFQTLGWLPFENTKDYCMEAFCRIPKLRLVNRGLRAFWSGLSSDTLRPQSSIESVHRWAVEILCKVLRSIAMVSPEDAGAVVQLLDLYRDEAVWKMMGDFVRRFLDEEAFTTALLVEVLCRAQTVQETDLMEHLLPVILHPAVSSFQLQQFSSRQKRDPHSSKVYPFSSWSRCRLSAQDRGKQDAAVVMSLYRRLAKDDLNMAGQLLKTIANDIATIYDDDLDPFIIPLLREMIDITMLQPAEASRFYSEAISTYIERKITRKPPKPQDWSLPNDFVECSRPGCKSRFEVREFLNDPDKEEQAFYVPEYRYKEVQEHFPEYYLISKLGSRREHRVRVTKSLGSWEKQYDQWQIIADHAQNSLRSLPETQLRQCLGDARYMDLIELRNVRVQSKEEPIPSGMEAEPTQLSGPVARKRKRE